MNYSCTINAKDRCHPLWDFGCKGRKIYVSLDNMAHKVAHKMFLKFH